MKRKTMCLGLMLFLWTACFSEAYALEQGRKSFAAGGYFTEQELAALPKILELRTRYYLFERSDVLKKKMVPYLEKYGYGYGTLHHFGVGLIYLNRINANFQMEPQKRNYLIKRAISEFSFVLDPRKLIKYSYLFNQTFLPVIYLKRGEGFLMQNALDKALKDLNQAIKIKPSYYYAYVLMSQCYRSVGDIQNAEKILNLGKSRRKN